MDAQRTPRFLIVEDDAKYGQWLHHSVTSGWPDDVAVIMDKPAFTRVRTAMTVRDYDIVIITLPFEESPEEMQVDGFEWIRKLRSQPGFPEIIVLAEGGSELTAVRSLRLGAADYLPKRLLTPPRLQRSIKLTLRAIERESQRRVERRAVQEAAPAATGTAPVIPALVVTPNVTPDIAPAVAPAVAPEVAPVAVATPAVSSPPAASIAPPTTTHTGSVVTRAAKAAVTDAAAGASGEMANVPEPAAAKDIKPIAPQNHHIPGYTLLQKIGESEAAAVYLAIANDLGHNCALKISKRTHKGSDPADTGARHIAFQREFEAIAALDHPSIIDLYDYGIHEGVEYLAMEYFPCGDLKARLQNPLSAREALEFLKQIALSLGVVHQAGIIHRDLKPPNVMLRDDGSVVLIDFGLARSLLSGDGSTRTGVLRGSPYYMSPEQAQGEVLDVRTDLYSLGIILYEMLAGKKPYLGASAIDVLQQHVMAPVPELPVEHMYYQPLLERLMAKSREQRLASCDELLAALESMHQARGDSAIIDPQTLLSAGVAG